MKITIWGAAQNVTGSKHLVQTDGYNLLLDCGFYQGRREASDKLNRNLPFPADKIDAVILTHAHLDHCGTLPTLVKGGFKGKIYCTDATADIARYILLNSAAIQKTDCDYCNSHIKDLIEKPIAPIYTSADVEEVITRFRTVPYFTLGNKWQKLNENIRFKFYDAGHILGSAAVLLEVKESGIVKTLVYSGDLGRNDLPILRSPEKIQENASTLLMECTYGNRTHRPMAEVAEELKDIVNEAVRTKSRIIAPAFSLGRIQELVYILHNLTDHKAIPPFPIYVDSPLADNITKVFSRYTKYFDGQFWKDFGDKGDSPFSFVNLINVRSVEESKALNTMKMPYMVIAASGMAEGGRILHHLKENIGDPNNIVLITGYQAEHTLGRKILEGISPIRIYGKLYDMRAKVIVLNELSAHADQNDLLAYVANVKDLKNLLLVHNELPQALAFKKLAEKSFPALTINIPEMGNSFEL
jgi:metallo-beta-lactamase family protein